MFNYILKVEFLPETSDENKEYNEKATSTITTHQKEIYDKVFTGNKTPDVFIYGTVEKYGLISGLRFDLANQLDTELVRRFEAAPFAK